LGWGKSGENLAKGGGEGEECWMKGDVEKLRMFQGGGACWEFEKSGISDGGDLKKRKACYWYFHY